MKVKIKRIDKDLPLPQYQTEGAVGFDFLCREQTVVPAKGLARIPGNVCVATPKGYMLLLASRGSTPFKKGLMPPHGIGVGDWDFSGDNDEYLVPVYNFTDEDVVVERGERIAQGIFIKVARAEWDEVETMGNQDRGGFGSTG